MRILDLDFFVHGAAHWRPDDGGRLDDQEFPAWDLEEALCFLTERCGLRHPLPGFVVENHGELFRAWRSAIRDGRIKVSEAVHRNKRRVFQVEGGQFESATSRISVDALCGTSDLVLRDLALGVRWGDRG